MKYCPGVMRMCTPSSVKLRTTSRTRLLFQKQQSPCTAAPITGQYFHHLLQSGQYKKCTISLGPVFNTSININYYSIEHKRWYLCCMRIHLSRWWTHHLKFQHREFMDIVNEFLDSSTAPNSFTEILTACQLLSVTSPGRMKSLSFIFVGFRNQTPIVFWDIKPHRRILN